MRSLWLLVLLSACGETPPPTVPTPEPAVTEDAYTAVGSVLDGFHAAAATADFDAYFDAMTADAVFIGTDATERWEREAFEAFARPHFEGDEAWTYTPVERHIDVHGDVAWFDERLAHDTYGEVRGSGVLRREDGGWKVAQYVLSFPIPNELAGPVVGMIESLEGE